ncbi:MAG: fibronectin type III domain-containing protein, partial [Cyclobacteriaceae bacterium]|nr:fibronectin type III domain-containing protein [Cyclobacteriaceae bacterium]
LTDEQFRDLKENTRYFWRVRYRDIELNWSPWSDMASFTTGESLLTANLLKNPGAEEETAGWSNEAGTITAMATRSEIHARSGGWHFRLSENVVTKDTIIAYQTVDLMEYKKDIAKGNLLLYYGGYLSGEYGKDEMTHQLFFLDKKGNILGSTTPFSTIRSSWDAFGDWVKIPPKTTSVKMVLTGVNLEEDECNCYADDLFIRLGRERVECR